MRTLGLTVNNSFNGLFALGQKIKENQEGGERPTVFVWRGTALSLRAMWRLWNLVGPPELCVCEVKEEDDDE